MTDEEIESLNELNVLDRARVIEIRIGGSNDLSKAVAAQLQVQSY